MAQRARQGLGGETEPTTTGGAWRPSGVREARAGDPLSVLAGSSPAMRDVVARLGRAARTSISVLLLGETGTGKEIAARALHEASPRRSGPFVAVNCAAVSESLLEAELFGHERGAFTGADRARPGLFVQAHGGTLFLDEIGETSPAMQAKLLRALESGEVRPIGGATSRAVDVRVVCATRRDLAAEVRRGAFRADLYYRLAHLCVELPPLRRRLQDLPDLVSALLGQLGAPGAAPRIGPEALARLARHAWPGNLRELKNVLRVALSFDEGGPLDPSRYVTELGGGEPSPASERVPMSQPLSRPFSQVTELPAYASALDRFDRRYYARLIALAGGNLSEIARRAGRDRKTVRKRLDELGLQYGE
jgi:DNA-binding NtrC family response regulator